MPFVLFVGFCVAWWAFGFWWATAIAAILTLFVTRPDFAFTLLALALLVWLVYSFIATDSTLEFERMPF